MGSLLEMTSGKYLKVLKQIGEAAAKEVSERDENTMKVSTTLALKFNVLTALA